MTAHVARHRREDPARQPADIVQVLEDLAQTWAPLALFVLLPLIAIVARGCTS